MPANVEHFTVACIALAALEDTGAALRALTRPTDQEQIETCQVQGHVFVRN